MRTAGTSRGHSFASHLGMRRSAWLQAEKWRGSIFSFALPETPFGDVGVGRADERRIAMTCVHHENNPEWLGTELAIADAIAQMVGRSVLRGRAKSFESGSSRRFLG